MAKFATYANNINWWLWHFSTTYTSLTIVLNHNTVFSLHLSKKCLKGHSSIKTELKSCLVLITKFPDCLPSFLGKCSKWFLFLRCPFLLLRRLGVIDTTSQLQKDRFARSCEVSWEVVKLGIDLWQVSWLQKEACKDFLKFICDYICHYVLPGHDTGSGVLSTSRFASPALSSVVGPDWPGAGATKQNKKVTHTFSLNMGPRLTF